MNHANWLELSHHINYSDSCMPRRSEKNSVHVLSLPLGTYFLPFLIFHEASSHSCVTTEVWDSNIHLKLFVVI